jgi:mannose-1-phosphate guanylyltransferase
MFAIIVAGGSGTRLWPVSRKKAPKQLLKIVGNETLLGLTFKRLHKGFLAKDIFVATTQSYYAQIKKQLPLIQSSNYSIEPAMRDRGPALGLAALIMQHKNPNASFITSWSDDFIKNTGAYIRDVKLAEKYLKKHPSSIIAIGAKPSSAHVGFRYINLDKKIAGQISSVKGFTDKPNVKTAEKYLASKNHLWNTGYFVTTIPHFLKLYQTYLPEVYSLLMQIKPYIGTKKQQSIINKIYPKMPKVDFESVLIKHPQNLLAMPASFDWQDVGRWSTVKEILSGDGKNLVLGNALVVDGKNNLVYNYEQKFIGAVGLENMIVVNTKDALLIIPKDKSEQVKELIEKLKTDKKLEKYL